jgi:hypothetical protein
VRVLVNAAVFGLVPVPVASSADRGSGGHRAAGEHPGCPSGSSVARLAKWLAAKLADLRAKLGDIAKAT